LNLIMQSGSDLRTSVNKPTAWTLLNANNDASLINLAMWIGN
jgi:hypothetical protein